MHKVTGMIVLGELAVAASLALAQRPGGGPPGDSSGSSSSGDLVDQMMKLDADKDGKLTKAEITDPRLSRLFDRADADKDGAVTRAELTALSTQEEAKSRAGGGGRGGPGGPGGMMGFPRPGEVLPPPIRQMLKLTDEQKAKVDDLQKDVDAKLAKILTDDQNKQFKQMRERRGPGGPGGFGPPPGGPGGPPPGEGGPPPGGPGDGPPPGDRPR